MKMKLKIPKLSNWKSYWVNRHQEPMIEFFHNDKLQNDNIIIIRQGRILGISLLLSMLIICFVGAYGFIENQIQTNINQNAISAGVAISNNMSKYSYYGLNVEKIRDFDQEVKGYFELNPSLYAISINDINDEIVQKYVRNHEQFDFKGQPNYVYDYYSTENKEGEVKIYLKPRFFSYLINQVGIELLAIILCSICIIYNLIAIIINGKLWQNIIFMLDFMQELKKGQLNRILPPSLNNEFWPLKNEINKFVESRNQYFFEIQQETNEAAESQIDPQNGNALMGLLNEMHSVVTIGKLGQPTILQNIKEISFYPTMLLMLSMQLLWAAVPVYLSDLLSNNPNNIIYLATAICGFLLAMVVGKKYAMFLMERMGFRIASVSASLLIIMINIALYFVDTINEILVLRITSGLGYGVLWAITTMLLFKPHWHFDNVINLTPIKYYYNVLFYQMRLFWVCLIAGLFIGAFLGEFLQIKLIFIVSSLVLAILVVLFIVMDLPEINKNQPAKTANILGNIFEKYQIWQLAFSTILWKKIILFGFIGLFIPIVGFHYNHSLFTISVMVGVFALSGLLSYLIVYYFDIDNTPNHYIILLALALNMAGIFTFNPNSYFIYCSMVFFGLGYNILSYGWIKSLNVIAQQNRDKMIVIYQKISAIMNIVALVVIFILAILYMNFGLENLKWLVFYVLIITIVWQILNKRFVGKK